MSFKSDELNKLFTPYIKTDYDLEDFQKFSNFVNSGKLINRKIVSKFFKFFLKAEIDDTIHLSLNPYEEITFMRLQGIRRFDFFLPVGNFKDAIFFNSFNKTFNGIVEMLHYNSKVRFPKRFIFLKKNEWSSTSNSVF